MARRGGRDGGWSRGWNLRVRQQRGRKPAENGQPNCAAILYHGKSKRPGKAATLHFLRPYGSREMAERKIENAKKNSEIALA
jgi:hypothetical protein